MSAFTGPYLSADQHEDRFRTARDDENTGITPTHNSGHVIGTLRNLLLHRFGCHTGAIRYDHGDGAHQLTLEVGGLDYIITVAPCQAQNRARMNLTLDALESEKLA
jgi:hypothetical protein